jgi:hypothetical protein
VKKETDVDFAIKTLIEAQARLKAAIRAGEQTSYYSGGQGIGKKPPEDELGRNGRESN